MFGTVQFDAEEVRFATQSKLDLVNYASAQHANIMRGGELDFA